MNKLENLIYNLNKKYIEESKNAISLVEDMAAMERYLAESYSGRSLIELIQNADDCCSSRIMITDNDEDIYFANNGKVFSEEDILSISRSGSSTKERGSSIGYRGIGFKSATAISKDIIIHSDDVYFSFSKKYTSEVLGISEKNLQQ